MASLNFQKVNSKKPTNTSGLPSLLKSQKSGNSFLRNVCGEHTAGTEFVIDASSLPHGKLLAGDLKSWVFSLESIGSAKLGTDHSFRLQLTNGSHVYTLERIVGSDCGQATIYQMLLNVLFSGRIHDRRITQTAVGIPFGLEMPDANRLMPRTSGWLITWYWWSFD